MAAPTPGARLTPNGRKLGDGYQTLVAFSADNNIAFWEQSITPPGIKAEDPKDTSTMHNTKWRTFSPRRLITMSAFKMNVHYDPKVYQDILALVNINTTVTVHFPDVSSLCFYGVVTEFQPDALEEGKIPSASVTVFVTNTDPSDCTEQDPVYTSGPGTHPC
jgi:hypothetical protein